MKGCKERIIDEIVTRYGAIKYIYDPYTDKHLTVDQYLNNGLRWDAWSVLTVHFVDGCGLFATRKMLRDIIHEHPFNPVYVDWSDNYDD